MQSLLDVEPCNVLLVVTVIVVSAVPILYEVLGCHGAHAAIHCLGGVQEGHDVTNVTLVSDDTFHAMIFYNNTLGSVYVRDILLSTLSRLSVLKFFVCADMVSFGVPGWMSRRESDL